MCYYFICVCYLTIETVILLGIKFQSIIGLYFNVTKFQSIKYAGAQEVGNKVVVSHIYHTVC